MSRRSASRALFAVALSVSLAACGGSDDEAAAGSPSATPTEQACETQPPTAEPSPELSTDLTEKPAVPATDAAPPCDLVITDIVVGEGPAVAPGDAVAVKYLGAYYGSGEEFDSSWSRSAAETIPVTVGQGRVIQGFDDGLVGMQVGGRRMLTIPSDLAYGAQGRPPIPGDTDLVFILDLVQVGP